MGNISKTWPITHRALIDAENYGKNLLKDSKPDGPSSSCREECFQAPRRSYLSYSSWSYSSFSFITSPAPQRVPTEEDSTKKWGRFAVIVGGTIALIGSYFLGRDIANWKQTNEELDELEDEKQMVQTELSNSNINLRSAALNILTRKKKILRFVHQSAKTGVISKTALIASAAILASGGFFASPILMGVGFVGTLGSGIAVMVRWGYFDIDKSLAKKVERLLGAVFATRARFEAETSTQSDDTLRRIASANTPPRFATIEDMDENHS